MGKLYFGEIVLVLFSACILSRICRGQKPALFIKIDVFLVVYVFFLGLSSLFSAYGGYALRGCVISFVLLLFYFYFRYVFVSFPEDRPLFTKALAVSATFLAVCSLAVVIFSHPWRVRIFFGNTLFLSNIFLMALPVLLATLIEQLRKEEKSPLGITLVAAAFMLNMGALYFTRSKTAAAVCFIALVIPLVAAAGNPKKMVISFVFLAIGAAAILFVLPCTRNLIFYDVSFGTASIRFYIYSGAAKMLKDMLLLGSGAYTFFLSYPPYIVPEYFSLPLSAEATYHAHNYFLESFVEAGAIGFLFLMFFFCSILRRLYNRVKADVEKGRFVTSGVFSAVIAGFLFNIFNINMNVEYFAPYFWIWLALGSSFACGKDFSRTGYFNKNTVNFIFVVVFLAAMFWHLKTSLISEYCFNKGVEFRESGDYRQSSEYFRKGLSENPFNVDALTMAAYVEGKLGNYGKALLLYDEILDYSPYFGSTMFNKADALFNLGEYDKAEQCLIGYLKHNPYDSEARINLGMIYNIKGDRLRALRMNLSILDYDDTDVDAAYNAGVILFELGRKKEAETMLKGSLDLIRAHKCDLITENLNKVEQSIIADVRQLNYKEAVILANLAAFYNSTGDREKAVEYINEACRLGKDHPVVEGFRDKILGERRKRVLTR
ncbi:MAG: tetratricopeptide repeat protein [Candidatus Aureabacteria bacterium]|nr:tetratricopeptide repeat protein [Candidatus Auribacterota bacterium]